MHSSSRAVSFHPSVEKPGPSSSSSDSAFDEVEWFKRNTSRSESLESEARTSTSSFDPDLEGVRRVSEDSLLEESAEGSKYDTLKRRTSQISQSELESPPPVAAYMLSLPTLAGRVDHETAGHQALADALTLHFPLADITLSVDQPSTRLDIEADSLLPWKYTGCEKGVHLFSAPNSGSLHTVAGVGLLNQPPSFVWEMVRNPACRAVYDRLFRSCSLVDQVNDYTRVTCISVAMERCLSTLRRELILVTSERTFGPARYVSASRSTEHPQCPHRSGVSRLNLPIAAFVVEPVSTAQGGEASTAVATATKLTYIVQVDLPNLPHAVVQYVMKRQALCIAYLRDKFSW